MIKIDLYTCFEGSLRTFNLHFEANLLTGKLTTLYGNSGVGKTSVLRMLAGLLTPDQGHLQIHETVWFNSKQSINVKPQNRNVGFVFQEPALFPNLTVKENLMYALDDKTQNTRISELVELIELGDLINQKPNTLSGGQKQRVALARALVRKPVLLMLDEPFSSLDQAMKSKLQDYVLAIHKEYNLTTLLVSHDKGEVFKMSDEVIIIENGKIDKQGDPSILFDSPKQDIPFQVTGEVIQIQKKDTKHTISVLIGNTLINVEAQEQEVLELTIGCKVLLTSNKFNPEIQILKNGSPKF